MARKKRASKKAAKKPKAPSASRWWRWSNVLHIGFNIAFPFAVLALIRGNLESLAVLLVLASKWRVFTVKPRHLIANIRANLTDFFVKMGTVIFMIQSDSATTQLIWTVWYVVWLTALKPKTSKAWMGVQAMLGQAIGLSALFQFSEEVDQWVILLFVWMIAYSSARHLLINYDEPWGKVVTYLWALFALELSWVLYKWTLLYGFIPQIVLILTAISYTAASLYDMSYNKKLKKSFMRQQIIMTALILIVIIVVADWRGQI